MFAQELCGVVCQAVQQVKSSTTLESLLQAVLEAGNHLNQVRQ